MAKEISYFDWASLGDALTLLLINGVGNGHWEKRMAPFEPYVWSQREGQRRLMFRYMLCKMVMTTFILKKRQPRLREVKGLI